jgi:hypothetical protein
VWAQQQEGRKVKQDDRDLIRECANATGARDKQFIEACHNLPERYRYARGAQPKSCK